MGDTLSIAMSGLQAARIRLSASAHNIANLGTEGFRPQQVTTSAAPGGGVVAEVSTAEAGSGDLIGDIVEQLAAGYAFRANALSLQRADETLGSLIDALA